LEGLKEKRGYCKLKEEALDGNQRRTSAGRGDGLVRQCYDGKDKGSRFSLKGSLLLDNSVTSQMTAIFVTRFDAALRIGSCI
jgi:hypothetical protein